MIQRYKGIKRGLSEGKMRGHHHVELVDGQTRKWKRPSNDTKVNCAKVMS